MPASLTVTPLIGDPLVAVVAFACPLPAGRAVSINQLLEHGPFIHYQRGSEPRHSVTAGIPHYLAHWIEGKPVTQFHRSRLPLDLSTSIFSRCH